MCVQVCSHVYGGQSVILQELPTLYSRQGSLAWSLLTRNRLCGYSQALSIHFSPPPGLVITNVYYHTWLCGDTFKWCWLWGLQPHGLVADEHISLQLHAPSFTM